MALREKVLETILSEIKQTVDEATPLSDLDCDSLEFAELLLEISKATGKEIPDEKWGGLQTVGDIIAELR